MKYTINFHRPIFAASILFATVTASSCSDNGHKDGADAKADSAAMSAMSRDTGAGASDTSTTVYPANVPSGQNSTSTRPVTNADGTQMSSGTSGNPGGSGTPGGTGAGTPDGKPTGTKIKETP